MRKSIRDENKNDKKSCLQKFAMGGVAKIRHEQSTAAGLPKKPPRGQK